MNGTRVKRFIHFLLFSFLVLQGVITPSIGQDLFSGIRGMNSGLRALSLASSSENSNGDVVQQMSIEVRELDGSGIPMIVAKGTRTDFGQAGYRESYTFEIHYSIYGGPVSGWGILYSDVLDWDAEELKYFLNGKIRINWTFSGQYSGGLFGEFSNTGLSGTFSGNYDGSALAGTTSGDWWGTVDGTAGKIDGEFDWTLNFTAGDITYPRSNPMSLTFEPLPEIASLIIGFTPTQVGVSEKGLYAADMSILALDSALFPVPYRKLNLEHSYDGQLKSFTIGAGESIITNGSGYASTTLLLDIDDLERFPEKIDLHVEDDLDDQASQDEVLPIALTTLEVDITSPSFESTVEADELWISGMVDADDLSDVKLSISVESPVDGKDSELGSATYPTKVNLAADGTFAVPVDLMTPGAWYKVMVTAENSLGLSHSDYIQVLFQPAVVLEIDSVDYPNQSLADEEFTISVTVSYQVYEKDTLTVDVTVGDEYDTLTFDVYPPQAALMRDPKSNQVITEVIEFPWTVPADTVHETANVEVQVVAKLNTNGTTSPTVAGFMAIGAVNFGDDCQLYVRLPFPATLDTHALALNLTRDHLNALASDRIIHPDWHKYYNGFDATVKCISHSTNLTLEVGHVNLELKGPIYDQWTINPDGDWKTIPHTFPAKNIVTEWHRPKDLIRGKYEFVMNYVVRDKDSKKSSAGQKSFTFRVDNLKVKFTHTTLESEEVSSGTNSYPGQTQGSTGGGTGSAGGSTSGKERLTQTRSYSLPLKELNSASITLDWDDSEADVDLHVEDPDGYVVGLDYLRDRIRNSVPGASYNGPDQKPETVEIVDPKEGDYFITYYVREADEPVDVTMNFVPEGALDLEINKVDSSQCPEITLETAFNDSQGDPIVGMTSADFTLDEDDIEQSITVTPIGTAPASIALLVDSSDSRESTGIREISLAKSIIRDLGSKHSISLFSFNDNVHRLQDFTYDEARLNRSLESLRFNGSTSLFDAVTEAAAALSTRNGSRAIVVLANGEDSASFKNSGQAIQAAREIGAPIYILKAASFEGGNTSVLAEMTGGKLITDFRNLSRKWEYLQPFAASNYKIRYTTSKPETAHELELSVSTGGLTASDTASLTACSSGCSCDVDGSGSVGVGDLQLIINQVLGLTPATCDINGDGHVGIADVQIVINAILGMGCNP